jgi:hypothetical protein
VAAPAAGLSDPPAPLRGIILRADAETLIVKPSESQVERYAPGAEVEVRPFRVAPGTRSPLQFEVGDYLYNRHGYRVAMVEEMVLRTEPIDATSFGDRYQTFRPGRRRLEIRAVGVEPE